MFWNLLACLWLIISPNLLVAAETFYIQWQENHRFLCRMNQRLRWFCFYWYARNRTFPNHVRITLLIENSKFEDWQNEGAIVLMAPIAHNSVTCSITENSRINSNNLFDMFSHINREQWNQLHLAVAKRFHRLISQTAMNNLLIGCKTFMIFWNHLRKCQNVDALTYWELQQKIFQGKSRAYFY